MMTEIWHYTNPVQITFGGGSFDAVHDKIAGRPYCLVTYGDNVVFKQLTERLTRLSGPPAVLLRDVEANPGYDHLRAACARFAQAPTRPQVIVALGGGSVIDTAKVIAAAGDDFSRVKNYLEKRTGAEQLRRLPIIAMPTTAGTGSEVTSWATVWDPANKKKYSLARPELYPEHAIVDPTLALGSPRGLTVSTGLDALSHALESIWNINGNPVSANHAVFAAREVLDCLPLLADRLNDIGLRNRMARACLFAGLAFSNTKTALAHSLSYHFTLHYGVPHGIACSFTLPVVMQSAIGCSADCDAALQRIFGTDLTAGIERLAQFIRGLGVSTSPRDHGMRSTEEWTALIDDALEGERGLNFIGKRTSSLELAA